MCMCYIYIYYIYIIYRYIYIYIWPDIYTHTHMLRTQRTSGWFRTVETCLVWLSASEELRSPRRKQWICPKLWQISFTSRRPGTRVVVHECSLFLYDFEYATNHYIKRMIFRYFENATNCVMFLVCFNCDEMWRKLWRKRSTARPEGDMEPPRWVTGR